MLPRSLLILSLLLPLQITAGTTPSRPNQDYALFFANDNYSANQNFTNLRNPVRDAETIADELEAMYGFTTQVYRNRSKREIYAILQQWQRRTFGTEDQLFIFFSGHGTFNELEKKGYFVPKGPGGDFGNYIDLSSMGNIVTNIPCPHILLAIDACYSGTIDQEIAFRGMTPRRPGQAAGQRNNLIQRQLRNESRLLITSGGKQRTPDGTDHSPFARAILDGLKAAYVSGDNLFIWPDLLARLERVSPRPHQGKLRGHDEGGFVFVVQGVAYKPGPTVTEPVRRSSSTTVGNSFTDRDGNTYGFKTMKDGKRWMTKNLNIEVQGSYCYDDDKANCQKYGRLYTWEAAKQACALLGEGWRLPTDEEWKKLGESYGGYYDR